MFQLVRINIRYVSHKCKAYDDVAFYLLISNILLRNFLIFLLICLLFELRYSYNM